MAVTEQIETATLRKRLHALVDQLPDSELKEGVRYLEGLNTSDPVLRVLLLAPLDSEPLTDEDLSSIAEAEGDIVRGDVEPWEKVRDELRGRVDAVALNRSSQGTARS